MADIRPPSRVVQTVWDGSQQRVVDWEVGRELGKGHFASAFEFKNLETGRLWAGKVIAKASLLKHRPRQKRLEEELDIHQSLSADGARHPNVLYMDSWFQDESYYYLILEICPHQTLLELLHERRTLTEWEVRYYVAQLTAGIKYCHERNILHRDLKLGNIFLGDGLRAKIADFGYAKRLSSNADGSIKRRLSVCGTPNYIAPEVRECMGKRKDGAGHGFEVDLWTIGIVMYTLLCGKPPFEAADGSLQGTYQNIEQGKWTFDKPPDHPHQIYAPHHPPSPEAQDLITKLLCHNYTERATIETIESHPFLSVQLPSTLPISALRVPPVQHDMHDIHGMRTTEPRLLFVCVEPTYAMRHRPAPIVEDDRGESSELLVKPRSSSRWRCCVAGPPAPVAPAVIHPVSRSDYNADIQTTHSDLSTADTGGHSNDEGIREFRPGDILSVVECGPVQTVDKLSLPSWIRTEDGWLVDTVRSSSSEAVDPSSKHCCAGKTQSTKLVQTALFAALPFVRPRPSICLGAVCTTAARQLHSVGQLLEDQIDTLRAQRDEALELASSRLHELNSHIAHQSAETSVDSKVRDDTVEEGVPPNTAGHADRDQGVGSNGNRAAQGREIPELPARPPELLPQTSAGGAITAEILSRSWADAKTLLLSTGLWTEPPENCAHGSIVGKRVWIDGQGPGVVRELRISERTGSTSHTVSFYALPQFLSVRTENAMANPGDVAAAYSRCPRLTARNVSALEAGGPWLVEAPLNES